MRLAGLVLAAVATGLFTTSAVSAQAGVQQVQVTAILHMPAVLRLEPGPTEVLNDGQNVVTRVSVYVTANCDWQLTLLLGGAVADLRLHSDVKQVRVDPDSRMAMGRSGSRVRVVLEYRQPVDAQPPRLEWRLVAA